MITRAGPRIFVSAGEPSGDLHGAGVVRALRERYPEASIEALGGPHMAQAGATLRYDMEGLAAFGFVEIVSKLGAHIRLLRALLLRRLSPASIRRSGATCERPIGVDACHRWRAVSNRRRDKANVQASRPLSDQP